MEHMNEEPDHGDIGLIKVQFESAIKQNSMGDLKTPNQQ